MSQGVGGVIVRNSFSLFASQIALKLLSFLYGVAIVRQLGDELFGQYSTVAAFVGIFTIFADLGMAGYVVREVAKDRSRAPALFGNMVILRMLLAVGMLISNVVVAQLLSYDSETVRFIALASVGILLYSFLGPVFTLIQGLERIDLVARYNVLNQVMLIAVGAILLWSGWGVTGVIVAGFTGTIIISFLSFRQLRGLIDLPFRVDYRQWLPLVRAGLPFGIITFATMLSFKVDTVMLSLWRTPAEVGWYNVAYNMVFALLAFASFFDSVLVPSLSRQYLSAPDLVTTFYTRAIRLLWMAALPIAVGTMLLSERIIVLIYGETYAPAGPVLGILIWVLPVLMITSLFGSITTVLHRERSTARINLINAGFNIALNIWAIRQYGLLGAAVTTVATEIFGLTQYVNLLRDVFSPRAILAAFAAPLAAVVAMAGAVILLGSLHVLLIIPLAALIYVVMLLATRGLDLNEVKLIATTAVSSVARKRVPAAE